MSHPLVLVCEEVAPRIAEWAMRGMEVAVMVQRRAAELAWVFRPEVTRPAEIRALAGVPIHATGPMGADGETEVVLRDGTRVRAKLAEIVAE